MIADDGTVNRYALALPSMEINTIGAGGGSIAWIDDGGLLRMAPQSAGADPGPACYGRGGTEPTCTDANLVLGYLSAEFFAGGRIKLDLPASKKVIEERIAKLLGSLGTGAGPIAVHAVLLLVQHQQRKILRGVATSSEQLVASSAKLETLTVRLVRLTWGLFALTVVLAVLTCGLLWIEMCGRLR